MKKRCKRQQNAGVLARGLPGPGAGVLSGLHWEGFGALRTGGGQLWIRQATQRRSGGLLVRASGSFGALAAGTWAKAPVGSKASREAQKR